ncbi:hypothetical protein HK405_010098 [Cladochytrium tenue]|nr:hypothetical protein HK405_010098 [Cladochytrium tenue]
MDAELSRWRRLARGDGGFGDVLGYAAASGGGGVMLVPRQRRAPASSASAARTAAAYGAATGRTGGGGGGGGDTRQRRVVVVGAGAADRPAFLHGLMERLAADQRRDVHAMRSGHLSHDAANRRLVAAAGAASVSGGGGAPSRAGALGASGLGRTEPDATRSGGRAAGGGSTSKVSRQAVTSTMAAGRASPAARNLSAGPPGEAIGGGGVDAGRGADAGDEDDDDDDGVAHVTAPADLHTVLEQFDSLKRGAGGGGVAGLARVGSSGGTATTVLAAAREAALVRAAEAERFLPACQLELTRGGAYDALRRVGRSFVREDLACRTVSRARAERLGAVRKFVDESEYDAVVDNLSVDEDELAFLRSKVRKLLAQNENRSLLRHERRRCLRLERQMTELEDENER